MDRFNSESGSIVSDLKEQVKRLESRLVGLEGHGRTDSLQEMPGYIEPDDTSSGMHLDEADRLNYTPKVRKCNFMEFKNRFSEEDARNAVDVLVSGPLFEQEYMEEQTLRDRLFEHGNSNARTTKKKVHALVKETGRSNNALRNDQSDRIWIRRIRLQAPDLLRILAKVQGESWSNRPRTYDRPFCTLIQFQPQVKQALAELEEKWATQSETNHSEAHIGNKSTLKSEQEILEEDLIDDSEETLAILRAYVEFMDEDIIPESLKFDNLNHTSDEQIIFSDLCYLFRPGEYIYKPLEGDQAGQDGDHRMGQRIWRVYFVNDAIRNYNFQPPDHRKYANHEPSEDDSIFFTVHAYHIEFTGDEFCVVTHTFRIAPYEGLRSISSLPIYPMRFNPKNESYLENALKIGDQVLRFIDTKHSFYTGWTVMRTPKGDFVTDSNGVVLKHPEHINSEVMVDFQEAFQACPSWRPNRTILKNEFTNKIMIADEFTIRWWSNKDRGKLLKETREIIPYRTGVHHLKRNKFIQEDPFLIAATQNNQRGLSTTKEFLHQEEKMLIHCRVFAYVFQERKFAQLDVSRLTASARNLDALGALKIPSMTKNLIQGSVRGHFLQKEAEEYNDTAGHTLDVIRGKGTGLFILLHGVPGVGKTATAEAVAQANGKPLFKITCGDIGLTPDQVEASLRDIFRLASIWDCILLMDEVDTFFSQRSKGDSAITKNALVSVFLRVLDYYTGILFLTTNRSGALDEAFKSRIHYKIYYPPLTKEQTLEIWSLNIDRLRHIDKVTKKKRPLEIVDDDILGFADFQFEDSKQKGAGRWNGRQIRNAFQVARSLAYYDALNDADQKIEVGSNSPIPSIVLDTKYFRMMHEITESFDRYMLEVFGGMNDGDLALEMEHRADHYITDRRYRSVRMREEYDDGYPGFKETRSPFNIGSHQEHSDRRRSAAYNNSRPSQSGPSNSQRHATGAITSGYDDSVLNDRNSGVSQPRLSRPSDEAPTDFRGSNPFDGEYSLQQNSHSGTKRASNFGSSDSRPFDRGNGFGGDSRHQSGFEGEQTYRPERNEFGKRERS